MEFDFEDGQERIFMQGLGSKLIDETFNESWDWLMEVVEKIEDLQQGRFQIDILQEGSVVRDRSKELFRYSVPYTKFQTKIEAVYNAVVAFIKWYNQNQGSYETSN